MRALPPGTNRVVRSMLLLASTIIVTASANASVGHLEWSVNFGYVKVGQSRLEPIKFTNNGSAILTISKYATNAAGFSVKGLTLPLNLAVGQSIVFEIAFTPLDGRSIGGNVWFYSNASDPVLAISVTGQGVTCGTLSENPGGISFGNVATGTSVTKSETITNTGTCNITLLQADVSGTAFTRSSLALPMTLVPGQSVGFSINFTPQSMVAVSGSLVLLSSAVESKIVAPLSGTGVLPGQLSISPSTMNFGDVVVGQSKSLSATVAASSGTLTISSASLSNSEFTLSGVTLPMTLSTGQSKVLSIKFTPKASGTASATLALVSNATNGSIKETVNGIGMAAAAHSVTLSWNASTSAVVGYNVYRGSQSGGPFSKINSTLDASRSYVDSGVLGGQTYYYAVTSVNSSGVESSKSAAIPATIPSP